MIFGFKKADKSSAKNRVLVVKTSRCLQNHPCPSVRVCPIGVLKQNGLKAPTVAADKCVKFCPMRALALK
ncbi:MAG: 4Fe-4S ferredoxin-type domain-containing protein [Clostridium sp.]|jgi:ferredoxin